MGEAGAGKTTLLNLLRKLLGRPGYEGFDPMKSTKTGRSRLMAQVAGMPVVYLEADRHSDDKPHTKTFEWDELKTSSAAAHWLPRASKRRATRRMAPLNIEVVQRNNRTRRVQTVRFVFHNSLTNQAYST